MRLTIKRVGGQLSTLQPTRVVDEADMSPETCALARAFVCNTPRKQSPAHPDAFTYVFELEEEDRITTTSASFDEVPESLRSILPSPKRSAK
jgi:hypothetical protein